MVALYLGHAVLALVALGAAHGEELRGRFLLWLGSLGAGLGVALFFLRHSDVLWRTTEVEPGTAVAAGLGSAAAWLLVATEVRQRRASWDAPLVGAASSALILFSLNRWIVPALLFWIVTSLALAALVRDEEGRAQVWFALAWSDLLVVIGLVWYAIEHETWRLPASADGLTWWFLVAGAVLRSCAVPRVGAWAAARSPALPLFAASAFALIAGVADREQPWVALVLLVAAVAMGAWAIYSERFEVTVIGAWPIAAMFGVLLVVPGAPWQAAAASLLALTAILLWPRALGRAQVERGLLLAFIPPLAGFSALLAAAVSTFDHATSIEEVLAAAPWTAVTALLPLVLATGVVLGARLGRSPEPEGYEPAPVIASWLVFGLAVVAGLWPRFVAQGDPRAGLKVFLLHVFALAAAAVAARLLRTPDIEPPPVATVVSSPLHLPVVTERVVAWSAGGLAVVALLAAAWLTIAGLQVGFL